MATLLPCASKPGLVITIRVDTVVKTAISSHGNDSRLAELHRGSVIVWNAVVTASVRTREDRGLGPTKATISMVDMEGPQVAERHLGNSKLLRLLHPDRAMVKVVSLEWATIRAMVLHLLRVLLLGLLHGSNTALHLHHRARLHPLPLRLVTLRLLHPPTIHRSHRRLDLLTGLCS